MKILGIPFQRRHLVYLAGDLVVALVAVYLGHFLRLWYREEPIRLLEILSFNTGASVFFVGTHILLLYVADAYSAHDYRSWRELGRLWAAVVVAFVVQMALFYALPHWSWGRGIAGYGTLSFGVLLTLWRVGITAIRPPAASTPTLVVGAGRAGHLLAEEILGNPDWRATWRLVGFLDDTVTGEVAGVPVLGPTSGLLDAVREHKARRIVVAIAENLPPDLTARLLQAKASGVEIRDMPTVYTHLAGKVPVLHVADSWLIFGPAFSGQKAVAQSLMRLADVVLALVGLTASLPLIVLSALAIKATSKGPVFYVQDRLGKDEVPFRIWKLRTMRVDAEKDGVVWASGGSDPRVFPVGRFLRRTRLDELPQFWNVLVGDMSVVGPRPERGVFVEDLKRQIPYYALRFAVKPGITGWAQVCYRYGASVEDAREKLQYELYAIQEMSPALYVHILFKTLQTMLLRPGS